MLSQRLSAAEAPLAYASQPLAAALEAFAHATGLQLVYRAELTDGLTSKGAGGQPTAAGTLRELLRDTGLEFAFINEQTVTIFRARTAGEPAGPAGSARAPSGADGTAVAGESGRAGSGVSGAAHRSILARLARFFADCSSAGAAADVCAPDPGETTVAAAAAYGFGVTQLQEIVVTGSRVIANGNDSPTPMTSVAAEDILATRHTTVFEALLDLPVFAGSRGAVTNPGAAGATNNNISALSLRGLGQARTLILYDGHRVPPTQQDGYVNANMIPQMLLQRIDIVTGGVSAVYGSDGITGVVNFITDRRFNGIKANVQAGISGQRDDASRELGIAVGMSLFGGRGHIEGSLQSHDDAGILLRTARQFGRERWTLQGSGTTALPYFMVPYATIGSLSFGGKITGPANNPLLNQQFVAPGVLGPFVNGSTVGVIGTVQIGGDGAYHTSSSLKAKLGFNQLYGRFDFDLADDLHFHITGAGTLEHSLVHNTDAAINGVTLSATNAFLPAAYQAQMTALNIASFTFGKMWSLTNGVGPAVADDYTRQWWVNSGLEGRLGAHRWEVSYTRSVATEDNRQNNAVDNGRLSAALDAVSNNGQTVCRVTVTNPGLYPGCVPLNVFGQGSEGREALDYIVRRSQYEPRTSMDDVSGSLTGAPFSDRAGPVNMALSAEWRRLGYELASNSLPVAFDPLDCTGLRFNCTPFNASSGVGTARASNTSANRPPVSQTVTEAALEADLPLLRDLAWSRSLDLNAAIRYARYSVTGSPILTAPNTTHAFGASTWKVGLDWKVTAAVRLRATRSRDFRAPNLSDLYAPGNITFTNLPDFLTGVAPNAQLQTGGNPNLVPEIGYTTTIGVVLKPTGKFSLSVDGYDITVRNAITNVNGYAPNVQSACYASGGTSYYCTLMERPFPIGNTTPANAVTKYYSVPVNIAEHKTWGVDVEVNYNAQPVGHALSLRGLLTYQPHSVQVLPGSTPADYAGVDLSNQNQGGAAWRSSVFARYAVTDRFTVDWLTRWRWRLHHNTDATVIVGRGDDNVNPAVAFSNLNLSYRFDRRDWGQMNVFLNVQNVFNQIPYPSANAGPQAVPGNFGGYAPGDDPIGRYYSLGMSYRL